MAQLPAVVISPDFPASVIQFTHLFIPPPPPAPAPQPLPPLSTPSPLRSANKGPLQKVGSLWTFFLEEAEDNYSYSSGLEVRRNGCCLRTGMKGSRNRTQRVNEWDKRERGRKRPHPGLTGPQPAQAAWDAWNVNNLPWIGFNVCFPIYFPPRSAFSSFYFHAWMTGKGKGRDKELYLDVSFPEMTVETSRLCLRTLHLKKKHSMTSSRKLKKRMS